MRKHYWRHYLREGWGRFMKQMLLREGCSGERPARCLPRRAAALLLAAVMTAVCAIPTEGKRSNAYNARTSTTTTTTTTTTRATTTTTASFAANMTTTEAAQTTRTTAVSKEIDENAREFDEKAAETSSPEFNEDGTPKITAGGAVVMDCDTGMVLYGLNENAQMPMASTTKIMTCILALESGDIGRTVTVTDDCMEMLDGTRIGLRVGYKITMHDLCVAMMMYSGNDAANTAAVAVGGSIAGFVSMMNEKAAELGMLNTHFDTPSGLDQFSDGAHYSTAYDMALLGRYAMENPDFRTIVGYRARNIYYDEFPKKGRTLVTHNYLMEGQKFGYKGCDGIKTGVTTLAGQCLVSHVTTDTGLHLVCASLHNTNRWSDHKAMYDYAKSLYEQVPVSSDISDFAPVIVGSIQQRLNVTCDTPEHLNVLKKLRSSLKRELVYENFLYAPIEEGDVVGYLKYSADGITLASYPIVAAEKIEGNTNSWFSDSIRAIARDSEKRRNKQ